MKRTAVTVLALLLAGVAPPDTTVVAGTVRDQRGAPIAGARVDVYSGSRRLGTALTAADGTFASEESGADAVQIACAFCVKTRAAIGSDGIVVAIVRRYDAVRTEVPNAEDLASLPYADVESALSLTPFILLSQASTSVIGAQVDDRRISGHGGLLVLNGTPDYDIATNASPYATIPDFDASTIAITRSQFAYPYGDTADAGTFYVDTTGGSVFAAAGGGVAAKAPFDAGRFSGSAGYSEDLGYVMGSRADARYTFSAPDTIGSVSAGSGRGSQDVPGDYPFASSFSSLRAAAERTRGADIAASFDADRGTYTYDTKPYPADVAWSDVDARASIRARSAFSPFALVSARRSTSEATLGQSRAVAGATLDLPHFAAVAALGSDLVSYASYGPTQAAPTRAHDGVFSVTWKPDDSLSLEASTRSGYWLPVFLFAYDVSPGSPITIDQDNALESTLTYSDLRRLKISLTALRYADQTGASSGSAGAAIAWQVAPKISLRAWTLRNSNDAPSAVASFDSAWATYDNGAFRADVIFRRDLRAGLPDPHVDASASGALEGVMRWFVATEARNGVRTLRVGLRF